jgi:monofunctional biosynthetic peptidoglycan transglycosylase
MSRFVRPSRDPADDHTLPWFPSDAAPTVDPTPPPPRRRGWVRRVAMLALKLFAAYYVFCVLLLVLYRFVSPPITGVQLQRRLEAVFAGRPYSPTSRDLPLSAMSPHVAKAVVAAEDQRFWTHYGYDFKEMGLAGRSAAGGGRMRGASTITQQLVKNLFGCACRNPIRKVYDLTLTPAAELILGKRRILELYLGEVEWGNGIWGVDAAARHHYRVSAKDLSRSQAAGLAALLPNPRRRTPANTGEYRREILRRMRFNGG